VAVAIGLAYRSLAREPAERERLITELWATRTQLAAATQALAETRQFIDELSPPALREATLVEALRRLAVQTGDSSGIPVGVTIAGSVEALSTPVETALLRIAQGALSNAVQHADATRIDLTLSMLDSEVILDVVDDGIGFTPTAPHQATWPARVRHLGCTPCGSGSRTWVVRSPWRVNPASGSRRVRPWLRIGRA